VNPPTRKETFFNGAVPDSMWKWNELESGWTRLALFSFLQRMPLETR